MLLGTLLVVEWILVVLNMWEPRNGSQRLEGVLWYQTRVPILLLASLMCNSHFFRYLFANHAIWIKRVPEWVHLSLTHGAFYNSQPTSRQCSLVTDNTMHNLIVCSREKYGRLLNYLDWIFFISLIKLTCFVICSPFWGIRWIAVHKILNHKQKNSIKFVKVIKISLRHQFHLRRIKSFSWRWSVWRAAQNNHKCKKLRKCTTILSDRCVKSW